MSTARKLHHLYAEDRPSIRGSSQVVRTGRPVLDELLPDGGWPKGDVVEMIVPGRSYDATDLLLPALHRLSRQGRWIALVTPPLPARTTLFTDTDINASRILQVNPHPGRSGLWTVESLLASGDCAAVLAWPGCDTELMDRRLRRAAAKGKALCVLFRMRRRAGRQSAIDLRIKIEDGDGGRAAYRVSDNGVVLSGVSL